MKTAGRLLVSTRQLRPEDKITYGRHRLTVDHVEPDANMAIGGGVLDIVATRDPGCGCCNASGYLYARPFDVWRLRS